MRISRGEFRSAKVINLFFAGIDQSPAARVRRALVQAANSLFESMSVLYGQTHSDVCQMSANGPNAVSECHPTGDIPFAGDLDRRADELARPPAA